MLRQYQLLSAQYYVGDEAMDIPGLPGYYKDEDSGIGIYHSRFPSHAASKAYSALIKYMKRYKNKGPGGNWFADVDFKEPPIMVLIIQDIGSEKVKAYKVNRVPASQSPNPNKPRMVVNSTDGRIRNYRWVNKVKLVNLSEVAQLGGTIIP